MKLLWALALLSACTIPAVWGLDGQVDLQLKHTTSAQVLSPGSAPQEEASDQTLAQSAVSDQGSLPAGFSWQGTLWGSLDSLPSGTPLNLPDDKLAVQGKILEAWLGWEPLPGVLQFGAGKRILHPSAGFSHTPLDWVDRGGELQGANATALWEEGWLGARASVFTSWFSAEVFAAPPIQALQTDSFIQGTTSASIGTVDLKVVALHKGELNRTGLGLQSNWGDRLTLRTEAAVDTTGDRPDTLAGFTWTNDNQSTAMAEIWADKTSGTWVNVAFFRWTANLDKPWDTETWTEVSLQDASGLLGETLTWTGSQLAISGSWLGSWGESDTHFGASPFRWQVTLETKVFF